jgi:hypothetical protein
VFQYVAWYIASFVYLNFFLGHTTFDLEDDTLCVRMDSFVHLEAWFACNIPIHHVPQNPIRIQGRLALDSQLYATIFNDRLRIDDLQNPEVWAEVFWPRHISVLFQ